MVQNPQSFDQEEPQPTVVERIDRQQLQQFVTTIRNAEQQVGENIIRALSSDGTVAVLTTVVQDPDGRQHVVSAALGVEMMAQIKRLLQSAEENRDDEEVCFGFHCLICPKAQSKP